MLAFYEDISLNKYVNIHTGDTCKLYVSVIHMP